MDYNEMQSRLQKLGVSPSVATLLRYRKEGLLPEAKKSHGGRGRGPEIDFPTEALGEAYANWRMFGKYKITTENLYKIRQIALGIIPRNGGLVSLADEWLEYKKEGLSRELQ